MKLAIVIPAYNEEKTINKVITGIPREIIGVDQIDVIVVDDNSSDATHDLAKKAGAYVVSHKMNLGAGGATITGLVLAKRMDADIVVTLDADGQHNPKEIPRLVKKHLKDASDVVIGSRFMSKSIKNMPAMKKIGNKGLSWVTYAFSRLSISDSQSGFRLFGKRAIEIFTIVDFAGYEFCSETIMVANKNKLTITEVPITTIYNSARKGGQNPLNGVNILIRMFYRSLVS